MRQKQQGFTLIELLVVVGIIGLLLGMLFPQLAKVKEQSNRTVCANNLKGISTAFATYATSNNNSYPFAGVQVIEEEVVGVQGKTLRAQENKALDIEEDGYKNNATASLFVLVRDGSSNAKQFICPSSGDRQDALTKNGTEGGEAINRNAVWDFYDKRNISYGMINMYHETQGVHWSSNADPEWVLMSDDNDAKEVSGSSDVGKGLHKNTRSGDDGKKAPAKAIQNQENSRNHDKEGQNMLRGDSSVTFRSDPFFGPSDDNVFADDSTDSEDEDEVAQPLQDLRNNSKITPEDRNVVVLSIEGNNGTNLSESGQ